MPDRARLHSLVVLGAALFALAVALGWGYLTTRLPSTASDAISDIGPTATPAVEEGCAKGERLLAAGQLNEAEAAFEAAGNPCPEPTSTPDPAVSPVPSPNQNGPTPSPGIARVHQARHDSAQRAMDGLQAEAEGDPRAAIAAYRDAMSSDTGQPLAKARLDVLLATPAAPSPSPYALARELAAAGFNDAAKEAAEAEIEARTQRGQHPAFPTELRYLVDEPEPLRSFNRIARANSLLSASLLVLGFVGLGLFVTGVRDQQRRRQRRLELGEVSGADAALAAGIKATIANEIDLLRREVGGDRLGLVIAPDAAIDIPVEVFEELPRGKLISALWKWTRPAPWTLTCRTIWDPRRGVGLGLSLLSPDKGTTEETIWDDDLRASDEAVPDATPTLFTPAHGRLSRTAGAWLAYTRATSDEDILSLSTLAAATWRSYALFRIGAEALLGEDYKGAAGWSAMALGEDPMNPGAAFNSGSLRLMLGKVDGDKSNVQYIEDARGLFARVGRSLERARVADGTKLNKLRLRLTYNCALLDFESAIHEPSEAAWESAVKAAKNAWQRLIRNRRDTRPEGDAARFTDMVEDATFALIGGALARRDRFASAKRRKVSPEPADRERPAGGRADSATEDDLRRAHRARMIAEANKKDLTAASVLEVFEEYGLYRLSPRARYNYACLLVDSNRLDDAVEELRSLVFDPSLAQRAKADPALDTLRVQHRDRWARVFPTEVVDLTTIGRHWGTELAKIPPGITMLEGLVAATRNGAAISRLARRIDAPTGLVVRWAGQAHLVSRLGLTAAESNLLDAAGVHDLGSLATRQADDLAELLAAVNRALKLLANAPDKDTVAGWIEEAKGSLAGTRQARQRSSADR